MLLCYIRYKEYKRCNLPVRPVVIMPLLWQCFNAVTATPASGPSSLIILVRLSTSFLWKSPIAHFDNITRCLTLFLKLLSDISISLTVCYSYRVTTVSVPTCLQSVKCRSAPRWRLLTTVDGWRENIDKRLSVSQSVRDVWPSMLHGVRQAWNRT